MRPSRIQIALLITVTIFFVIQFLPHRVTSLVASRAPILYIPLAAMLLFVILVVTAFYVVVWIGAPNEVLKQSRRNWLVTCGLSLLIALVFTAGNFVFLCALPLGSYARSFDQAKWKSAPLYVEGDITERQKMLGSAIHDVVIAGEKDDIIKALGPTEEGAFSTACDLVYHLGPQRTGFPIDDEWLLIWCDGQGRVVRYDVWTD